MSFQTEPKWLKLHKRTLELKKTYANNFMREAQKIFGNQMFDDYATRIAILYFGETALERAFELTARDMARQKKGKKNGA